MSKITEEEILQQFITKHNNFYNYSNVVYTDRRVPIDIICPIHGLFPQTPEKHLLGRGCPDCGKILQAKTKIEKASKKFVAEADNLHNGIYDYSLVEYKKATLPVKLICKKHGIFEISPNKHLDKKHKRGCQQCGWERCEPIHNVETYRNKRTILYYIKVDDIYKIGITMRKNTLSRYSIKERNKITVLNEWVYEDGSEAYKLEKNIIKSNISNKYSGIKLLDSGNTELFHTDIITSVLEIVG